MADLMMKRFSSLLLASSLPMAAGAATLIEAWEYDDAPGTQFSGLLNSVGTASWSGDDPDAVTDGAGTLVFTQGSGTDPDNIFRSSTLGSPNVTTGIYQMEWYYTSAALGGGDATGANMGYGMRDDSNTDLFLVRLQRQNNTLRLQTRVGTTNTNLEDFGVTSLSDLHVRVVADLDADTFDVFWQLGIQPEQSSLGNAMAAAGLEFDMVRMLATTNVTDWGATDTIAVDYLRVSQIPEPGVAAVLGALGLAGFLRRRRC